MNPTDLCSTCGGERAVHRHDHCGCRHPAERAYWAPFNALPDYDKTRELTQAWENAQPPEAQPCPCRGFTEMVVSE